jgi:hypothetical protein
MSFELEATGTYEWLFLNIQVISSVFKLNLTFSQ